MNGSHDEKLRQIVQHAWQHAPAVRATLEQAGLAPQDIRSTADLEKIPVTSKDRLVELQQAEPPFGGFLAVPPDSLEHIFLSPGPLYEPHAGESAVLDTINEIFDIAGFKPGEVVINTFGYHYIPTGLATDQALVRMGATVIPAGVGNADLQLQMMRDLKVTGYLGTPSWLMALLQKAAELKLDFRREFSLRKVLVSAEPLTPAMRQTFVETYDLQVTNAYGTAELGFLAYNQEGGLAMRLLESAIVQVANPETGKTVEPGEAGEVVVTTFNRTYPLIRLGTGDLALNVDPAPGVSRQGERSIILVGRAGEAVKVRGMFVHPNQLRFALTQVGSVERFQAVVTRPADRDELTLRVVLAATASASLALEEALSTAVQAACRVKAERIEFVPLDQWEDSPRLILDQRSWD